MVRLRLLCINIVNIRITIAGETYCKIVAVAALLIIINHITA